VASSLRLPRRRSTCPASLLLQPDPHCWPHWLTPAERLSGTGWPLRRPQPTAVQFLPISIRAAHDSAAAHTFLTAEHALTPRPPQPPVSGAHLPRYCVWVLKPSLTSVARDALGGTPHPHWQQLGCSVEFPTAACRPAPIKGVTIMSSVFIVSNSSWQCYLRPHKSSMFVVRSQDDILRMQQNGSYPFLCSKASSSIKHYRP
jgi:hypothetical protein